MKIKKIISLIESLDDRELKQLVSYLNEEPNITQYPPEIQRLIEERNTEEIAKLIKSKKIKETKDLLMLQNNEGDSVAHFLAKNSDLTKWSTNDKEILMLTNNLGNSVAHFLAKNSEITKWSTNDKEILMLTNNLGNSIAHYLAENHPTWITDDPDILKLKNYKGKTVRSILRKKR